MTLEPATSSRSSTFGPSALATPANAVSIVRLLVTIPFLGLIVEDHATYPAVGFWIVLCVTDGIDGYLARRHGTTRSGAFLDPLADKVLVLGAAWALVAAGVFAVLPVALITLRELGIQALRSYYARSGLSVPATGWAKAKTVVQQVAIGFAFLPLTESRPWIADSVLWVAVALTVWTGAAYLVDGRRATRTGGSRD